MSDRNRLSGHALRAEGAPYDEKGDRLWAGGWSRMGGDGRAKCSCGALSEVLSSATARRQWHRDHKALVRRVGESVAMAEAERAAGVPFVTLDDALADDRAREALRERLAAVLHGPDTETPLRPDRCSRCRDVLRQADALLPVVVAEKAAALRDIKRAAKELAGNDYGSVLAADLYVSIREGLALWVDDSAAPFAVRAVAATVGETLRAALADDREGGEQ